MRKRTQSREYALQVLYQMEVNPEPLDEALENFWQAHRDSPADVRDYTRRLVEGCHAHQIDIDQLLSQYTQNWQIHRMAIVDRNILRLGAFEIVYCEDVPPKVAINEAVNIAKKFSQEDSGKFVNGILDKIGRNDPSGAEMESDAG